MLILHVVQKAASAAKAMFGTLDSGAFGKMTNGHDRVASSTSAFEREMDPQEICLDPHNPRLSEAEQGAAQEVLVELMIERFNVDELAESIIAAGFLDFDPIIGWEEDDQVFVREGNRRIATLQLLLDPELAPEKYRERWRAYSESLPGETQDEIRGIRIAVFPSRDDAKVTSYIGFRHVAGIKQWPSHEKAAFIAELIEQQGWDYEAIADRLGSYPKHVERHYIAHRMVQQARQDGLEGAERMARAFGVLLRALQAAGVREFLGFEYPGEPAESVRPIPEGHESHFREFTAWTFGTDEREPILGDSRQLTKWGRILQSEDALSWMRRTEHPDFERAWMKSGGQVESLADSLYTAADRLEESVALVRRYEEDEAIRDGVSLCTDYLSQILQYFPTVRSEFGIRFEADEGV